MDLQTTLASAATQYDIKQSTKRGYNPYGLGLYLEAVERAVKAVEQGSDVRTALLRCFNDRLLDAMLKAVGEPKATAEEIRRPKGWRW